MFIGMCVWRWWWWWWCWPWWSPIIPIRMCAAVNERKKFSHWAKTSHGTHPSMPNGQSRLQTRVVEAMKNHIIIIIILLYKKSLTHTQNSNTQTSISRLVTMLIVIRIEIDVWFITSPLSTHYIHNTIWRFLFSSLATMIFRDNTICYLVSATLNNIAEVINSDGCDGFARLMYENASHMDVFFSLCV